MSEKADKAESAAPKKGRKGLIIGILAAVLLASGGGAAAWKFMGKAPVEGEEAEEEEVHATVKQDPVFVPLDQFTVNLADQGGDRMIQVSVTLEMLSKESGEAVKKVLPGVRNTILMLLSSKKADEVLSIAGKEKLAEEIGERVGLHLGWQPPIALAAEQALPKGVRIPKQRPNPVEHVHFAHFIVQ